MWKRQPFGVQKVAIAYFDKPITVASICSEYDFFLQDVFFYFFSCSCSRSLQWVLLGRYVKVTVAFYKHLKFEMKILGPILDGGTLAYYSCTRLLERVLLAL